MSEKTIFPAPTSLTGLPFVGGPRGFWRRAHVQGWVVGTLFNMVAMQACYPGSKAYLLSGGITFLVGGAVAHKVEDTLVRREISLYDWLGRTQKSWTTPFYIESDLTGEGKAYASCVEAHYWRDFAKRCVKAKAKQAGAFAGISFLQAVMLTGLGLPWQNAAVFVFSSALPLCAEIVAAMSRWRAVWNDKKRVLPLPKAQNG
ncbi:MAG: hypothetical protein EOM37_06125 [Proteobacteria bacterium]|nr:hypothetical protein [Alphaproteobacteria bacterium]NCC03607.1 hypothetical protein [Pseudomonadota bacterium]